jgi:2-polyprenyl-6-hydroxyphenyl methylase / 3-demethylubiquinone-9 3-methyltransferase
MAVALAGRGAKVTAVDPSEGAIATARRRAEENKLEIEYRVSGGESLPFAAGVFDVVVCVDVLEHVEDLQGVLSEVRRVLRANGIFLFDTINRTRLATFLMVTVGENMIGLLPRGRMTRRCLFDRRNWFRNYRRRASTSGGLSA